VIYAASGTAIAVFVFFVGIVLGLSFWLGRKAKSAQGYYAAHGQVHWFVNGIAFAGDYLSAASFLGICGMIAFYGYDGFLYSIGYLAGWIVALFVVAEPLKRMGKFTFADALDSRFNSRGIKLAAAISTLVVSIFYLIPQMVGAGALITPLLGFPHYVGVLIVGAVVTLIVVTAGMVSTTWVQFIKGSLLVFFCTILTFMILNRGFKTDPSTPEHPYHTFAVLPASEVLARPGYTVLPDKQVKTKDAQGNEKVVRAYACLHEEATGKTEFWLKSKTDAGVEMLSEAQTFAKRSDGKYVNGIPQGKVPGENDLHPIGHVSQLPGGKTETGPLGPLEFFDQLAKSTIVVWRAEAPFKEKDAQGAEFDLVVYYPVAIEGSKLLVPGGSPTFKDLKGEDFTKGKLDFLSLMLALFCGTASLPHILIRYYTVKDRQAVRKSTVVGIAAIGFFYVLTLYLGLGAMTSGMLDPTDTNMSAPLLARSFGELLFAVLSAIAFTTVLGTVSGLIMAASGAVAHDLLTNFMKLDLDDHAKVRAGKFAAVAVGAVAIVLGILFKNLNVTFLVGWAFNIAASANLPALILVLFWKGVTKQGITAAIVVGMVSSLTWILLSGQTFAGVYKIDAALSPMPFSQPAIVTIPLGFLTLIAVSLLTQKTGTAAAISGRKS